MLEHSWKNRGRWFPRLLFLALLFGCAHPPPPMDTKEDWTVQGSGAFHTVDGSLFQAVGSAQDMKNTTLLKAAAANRAKAQLSALLSQYVSALIQYSGQDMGSVANRQLAREIVQQGLDRARITDQWYDPAGKKNYARCILPLASFKQMLSTDRAAETLIMDLVAAADQVFEAFVSASDQTGKGR